VLLAQVFPTIDPNATPTARKQSAAPAPAVDVNTPAADDALKAARAAMAKSEATQLSDAYVLGGQDTLIIRVADMEEMGEDPYPIDLAGNLTIPRIGRVHAAGLTIEQLQMQLVEKLHEYLQNPVVTISVAEFHSQPVSILGAVESPGVHQIRGNKTLFEVIAEAGGLKDDAGNTITVTRQMVNGELPLPNAVTDASGRFSSADLNIRAVMSAKSPQDNIPVKPYDIITVPKADLIYVMGPVKRAGGFALQERSNMTVLEAVTLAQGLERTASSHKGKIFRVDETTHARLEIPVDVQKILDGKGNDTPLLSNDILYVPSSSAKLASYRALEAIIQTGTGLAIYRP